MAKVDVTAIAEHDAAAKVQRQVVEAEEAVRARAHELAMRRTPDSDFDIENWLRAEQQLFWVPNCELVELNGQYRLRAAVPGLEARQIRLTALPEKIVINGAPGPANEAGKLRFSEFNRNKLLRHIDLPSPIDLASIKAKLERGVLELVASKQTEFPVSAVAPTKRVRPKAKRTTARKARAKAAKAKD